MPSCACSSASSRASIAGLERRRLRVDELDEARLEEFLRSKYRKRGLGIPKTVSSFLEHLRRTGTVAVPAAFGRRLTQSEIIERDFTRYLEEQRGLAASTVVNYVAGARALLGSRFGSGPVRLARLNASQITDFVTDYARRQGATATQTMATALRSFLRFLQQRGDVAGDLASSVPSVARWQLASLPPSLTARCGVAPGGVRRGQRASPGSRSAATSLA